MKSHDQQPAEPVRVQAAAPDRIEVPPVEAAGVAAVGRLLDGGPVAPSIVAEMGAVAGNAAASRLVHRSALPAQGAGALDPQTAAAIDAERGGGSPLADLVRSDMERHLGVDLSGVRVHTGPAADTLSRAVTAKAFTTGTDVFFGAGRYDPTSRAGRELLAHELTHVVQQAQDPGSVARVSHEDDPTEVEARAVARSVAHNAAAPPVREAAGSTAVGGGVVARDPWHKEAPTGTPRPAGGPIGYIQIGLRQISSDPQVATQQLRDIAVKDGPQEAQRVFNEIRLRRAQLLSQRHETWKAQDPVYLALVTALDAELKQWDQYEQTFKEAAENKTREMLKFSEQRVTAERDRYGLTDKRERGGGFGMADNLYTKAMASAARQLADELTPLEEALEKYVMAIGADRQRKAGWRGSMMTGTPLPAQTAPLSQLKEQVRQAEERYLVMRHEKEARFPILSSFAAYKNLSVAGLATVRRRLDVVGRGAAGGEQTAALVAGDAFEKLKNIAEVRAALANGSLNIWAADNVVRLTKLELGIAKGSLQDRIVDQQVAHDASDKALSDMLFSAFAIALGLLAAPLTAGVSLVAGAAAVAGGVAISAGMALEHLEEYQLEEAANATDFDKARVISSREPSLFWLAVDIVGVLVDAGGAVRAARIAARAFERLAPRARAVVNASDDTVKDALDALEQAAAATVPDHPELGRTVRDAAERELGRRAPDQATVKAQITPTRPMEQPRRTRTLPSDQRPDRQTRAMDQDLDTRTRRTDQDRVPTIVESFSSEGISDAERAIRDRTIAEPPVLLTGSGGVNETYLVKFSDGSYGIFKPISGEYGMRPLPGGETAPTMRLTIPIGNQAYREVAAFRLDELFGFDLVPPTTLREAGPPARGPGSMQQFVDHSEGLDVGSYAKLQEERMAVLDYISGNTDRHGRNYVTALENNRLVAIDHGYAFPGGPADPIKSDFVSSYLGRDLSAEVVDAVRAADPERVREVLRSSGLDDDAIEGALQRLREVQSRGKITGESWPGMIKAPARGTSKGTLPRGERVRP
jgi:hypothetical protein